LVGILNPVLGLFYALRQLLALVYKRNNTIDKKIKNSQQEKNEYPECRSRAPWQRPSPGWQKELAKENYQGYEAHQNPGQPF
jgi:hypothetical protein